MGWFDDDSDQAAAYDEVINAPHRSHLSHELIAAAASYEAMKGYEKHVRQNGQPADHEQAKEILAGLSGFFVDKLVETKGLDFVDREKAKRHANRQLHEASREDYY